MLKISESYPPGRVDKAAKRGGMEMEIEIPALGYQLGAHRNDDEHWFYSKQQPDCMWRRWREP